MGYMELERAVGKNAKMEGFKLECPNEIGKIEVGEFKRKLKSSDWSWKVQLKLESDL